MHTHPMMLPELYHTKIKTLPHMQLHTWKHLGFTSWRCSDEENGAAWWLTEGGCRQPRKADVVLVEADGNEQRWWLDLVRGWPPHHRSAQAHGSEHERLAFGRRDGAGNRLLVVDFFHAFDLVRGCCVNTWRRLARGGDAYRSCGHGRAGHQGNERFFHGLLLVQV